MSRWTIVCSAAPTVRKVEGSHFGSDSLKSIGHHIGHLIIPLAKLGATPDQLKQRASSALSQPAQATDACRNRQTM